MNKDRVRKYVEIWLENIDTEEIEDLEKDIEMPFVDFVVDLLENVYNDYCGEIKKIPEKYDSFRDYIIESKEGSYTLEDFLINHLLRNIRCVKYSDESHRFGGADSHYAHDFSEVVIDSDRMKKQIPDVYVRRKLVAHELLHGLKTQFLAPFFIYYTDYYKTKEKLKRYFPTELNDFSFHSENENLDCSYKHCGLNYWSKIQARDPYLAMFDGKALNCLDEIFNEKDALSYAVSSDERVLISKLRYCHGELADNVYNTVKNIESSNAHITNYAYILDMLIDRGIRFVGLFLEPTLMFQEFDLEFSSVFSKNYQDSSPAMLILTTELTKIKDNPKDIERHIKLLNTLYDCLVLKYGDLDKSIISTLNLNGLVRFDGNKLHVHERLKYSNKYNADYNK